MLAFREQYIVDELGRKTGVILNIEDYKRLLEELEELEAIRVYDKAKASNDEIIYFEQAIAEIASINHQT